MSKSFTVTGKNILRVLKTPVQIAAAFDISKTNQPPAVKQFIGIWDTGATGSVITQKVIDDLGLKATGMAKVHGVQGEHDTETFLVSISLPNKVGFPSLRVTRGVLCGDANVLIGMDIITHGDFAVTHKDNTTIFTFRMPSIERFDFVKPVPTNAPVLPRPNDPCFCGSKRKYKKCCGHKSHA